jgi:type IV secretion system protein VirB5
VPARNARRSRRGLRRAGQAYERGSLSGTSRWTAVITIKLQPPRSAEVLRKNPLGLYVDAIDWSRELETPAPGSTTSALAAPSTQAVRQPGSAAAANLPLGSPLDPALAPLSATQPVLEGEAQ